MNTCAASSLTIDINASLVVAHVAADERVDGLVDRLLHREAQDHGCAASGFGEILDGEEFLGPQHLRGDARGRAGSPLEVNADESAAALAVGLGAERIIFVSDVPGVLMGGVVVESIAVDDAERMLGDGTFKGGIVPKLEAAVLATRGGVRAAIGATEVVA